jgi:hypothetical protein
VVLSAVACEGDGAVVSPALRRCVGAQAYTKAATAIENHGSIIKTVEDARQVRRLPGGRTGGSTMEKVRRRWWRARRPSRVVLWSWCSPCRSPRRLWRVAQHDACCW